MDVKHGSMDPAKMTSEEALQAFAVQQEIYRRIEGNLRDIDVKSTTFRKLQDDYELGAEDTQLQQICSLADRLTTEVHSYGSACKRLMDDLKKENAQFAAHFHMADASASLEMRQNLYNSMTRRFQKTMSGFRDTHENFRATVKSRQVRRLKQLDKRLDDLTIEKIVENGQVEVVVQQSLMSDDLRDCIVEIEQRHSEVLALERNMRELFELFKDVANLVDQQDESLAIVGEHVRKAKDYAERGEQHLKEAEKSQKCSRKCQCCILCLVILALLVILIPILLLSSKSA